MAFRCLRIFRTLREKQIGRCNVFKQAISEPEKVNKSGVFTTENNLVYYEDPDKFGTLSPKLNKDKIVLEDEGDIKEEKYISESPLPTQKLTTRQYADLIKQYLKHKRLKEAINVLEVRMLQEDRVKPVNYIYNILIGACAEVGYTKKAFKLYNEMKKRALKPTGDTYTCLFHACSNSPWPADGLKLATHIRQLMIEKGIEPNLTNYNSMIKAFGRCGDLVTAFKIADEMVSKGIKIRVHTFNHLLQACISGKDNGLRHALVVWRKMLKQREKPNIYSFNLILKCVKECNLGSHKDIQDLICALQDLAVLESSNTQALRIKSRETYLDIPNKFNLLNEQTVNSKSNTNIPNYNISNVIHTLNTGSKDLEISNYISMQLVNLPKSVQQERTLPNLLSKQLQMQQVQSLQTVESLQEKFAVIGGQEDFLKEMEVYSVKPDVKTFTQMLPLLEESMEAEDKLLSTMKALDIRADISFYNMLIKKRSLRMEYDAAFDVMNLVKKEGKIRLKRFPDRKKLHLKANIMTYGVLSMACKTKERAEKLLKDMEEAKLKVNIEILGTLLRQGTANTNIAYVLYIMNLAKEENLEPNATFLKHLEDFNERCTKMIRPENGKPTNEVFTKTVKIFAFAYKNWLKDVNIDEVLKPEHPWAQFHKTYPETVQHTDFKIKNPKRFYKTIRKYVKYVPSV